MSTDEEIEAFLSLYQKAKEGQRNFRYWYFTNIMRNAHSWALWNATKKLKERFHDEINFMIEVRKEIAAAACNNEENYPDNSREDGLYAIQWKGSSVMAKFTQEPRLSQSSGWSSRFYHWNIWAGFSEVAIEAPQVEQVIQKVSLEEVAEIPLFGELATSIAIDENNQSVLKKLISPSD
jgi:reverse gyrase